MRKFIAFLAGLIFGLGLLLAGMAIYVFNWKVAFAKLKIQEEKKRQLAVSLALFTAPYLFLLPSSLLYR